jgi:hypothetical protein
MIEFTPPDFRFIDVRYRHSIESWDESNRDAVAAVLNGAKPKYQNDLHRAWFALDEKEKTLFAQLMWRKNKQDLRFVSTVEWYLRQQPPVYPSYISANMKLLAEAYGLHDVQGIEVT